MIFTKIRNPNLYDVFDMAGRGMSNRTVRRLLIVAFTWAMPVRMVYALFLESFDLTVDTIKQEDKTVSISMSETNIISFCKENGVWKCIIADGDIQKEIPVKIGLRKIFANKKSPQP